MPFYENHVLPHLVHCACSSKVVDRQRAKSVPAAHGRILEIGMGSGLNIPHYDPERVELVWGLEPSEGMRRKARRAVAGAGFEVRWLDAGAEAIPLDTASADTVLLTYTLCTIPGWRAALDEMRRVLKPRGTLLFCEHGRAPEAGVAKWQDRINPLWRKLAGGCNVNRSIPELITARGFRIRELEQHYLPRTPRFAGFNYRGVAHPA